MTCQVCHNNPAVHNVGGYQDTNMQMCRACHARSVEEGHVRTCDGCGRPWYTGSMIDGLCAVCHIAQGVNHALGIDTDGTDTDAVDTDGVDTDGDRTCRRCGRTSEEGDMVMTAWRRREYWCAACVDEYAAQCEDCAAIVQARYTYVTGDNRVICYDCYDDAYVFCAGCGEIVHWESAVEVSGDWYCESCAQCGVTVGDVYDYHQGPQLDPRDENGRAYHPSGELVVGMEIECTHGSASVSALDDGNDLLWKAEQDSSLPVGGVEVITAPAVFFNGVPGLEEWSAHRIIKSAFSEVRKIAPDGHVGGSTGGHVHIDRRWIASVFREVTGASTTEDTIEAAITAVAADVSNMEAVRQLTHRLPNRYCERPDKWSRSNSRYREVNTRNGHTVEFRRPASPEDEVQAYMHLIYAVAVIYAAARSYGVMAAASGGALPEEDRAEDVVRARREFAHAIFEFGADILTELGRDAIAELTDALQTPCNEPSSLRS